MANAEWEQLKEALRKAPTEEARKAAAEAMRRYLATHPPKSKPTLVSLGLNKPYPTSIPLEQIPGELERNPAFFEQFRKIVEEG
ncbi:MAG TPA: hypothetical protein VMV84_04205 [Dehalococcoidales bacterium]|nr:hypothetical protein [Dehalococcoidales bacterium]